MARLFDDGASQYLEIDQAVSQVSTTTLACWMYTDDTGIAASMLGLFDKSAAAGPRFAIVFNEVGFGGAYAGAWAQDDGGAVFKRSWKTTVIAANTWYHVAGTFDTATEVIGYTNGSAGAADVGAYSITGGLLDRTSIGRFGDSSPNLWWSGGMAEVAAWNVILTPAEIAVLATGKRPIFVRPQNIVAYWPLVRDQDYDLVGGYNMTPGGGPTIAAHPPVIYGATPGLFYEAGAGSPVGVGLSSLSGLSGLSAIMQGG